MDLKISLPSSVAVQKYFGAAAAFPEKWRRPMLGACAGLEHGLAKYNDEYNAKKGGGKFEDAAKSALPLAALGGLLGHYLSDDVKVDVKMKKDSSNAVSLLLGIRKDF